MPNRANLVGSNSNECYLCGRVLRPERMQDQDHVIPDKLFLKYDSERPKLPVHHDCNNKKSTDDEWFIKQLQLRCSFNQEAEASISSTIDKAIFEKPDAYIIGKKVRNYRLVMGIFNEVKWGLQIEHDGTSMVQMRLTKTSVTRFRKYLETMCRGLFLRNVPTSKPSTPKLLLKQRRTLKLAGKLGSFTETIKELYTYSKFGYNWGNRIFYFGSPAAENQSKGFVYVEFYSEFGILAWFE